MPHTAVAFFKFKFAKKLEKINVYNTKINSEKLFRVKHTTPGLRKSRSCDLARSDLCIFQNLVTNIGV